MSGNDRYDSGARPYDEPAGPAWGSPPAHGAIGPAAPWQATAWAPPATDRVPPSDATVVVAWVLVLLTGFYLLPWAIAATRGKADRWGVFWLTLLLGWTGIGWVIALIWSVMPHRPLVAHPVLAPGWYPQRDGGLAYWDGRGWTGHRA
ncbi:superinfection immunity protein [Cellulomonas gilvus]|uniref:DUF2510 domain-containing protein n=1 Tax=Cellulomonas gilvus (strain ATCC 13127 / NRRL B-14078) TaxID=593907 RepID=F8A282_CELGA|nr:superinfection immunity protein [Cellulomonas gilvus]AEI10602.1 hypothetical protein Celgi_0070 [Cellulomonas gilvus ATCC 13127]